MKRFEGADKRFTQVVQQVPAIGNLDRLWRCFGCGFGIQAGAITADNLRPRMAAHPLFCTLLAAVWQ
jgi:hypothetical protein